MKHILLLLALVFLLTGCAQPAAPVTEVHPGLIDRIQADAEGDGITEDWTLTLGPTSGVFSFVLSAQVEGEEKYSRVFSPVEYQELSFVQENGQTLVQGISLKKEIHRYTISVEDGALTLTENGAAMKPLDFK